MKRSPIERWFADADDSLSSAIVDLQNLIRCYEQQKPEHWQARVAALKGKIGVITSIDLNPKAFPWVEDDLRSEK